MSEISSPAPAGTASSPPGLSDEIELVGRRAAAMSCARSESCAYQVLQWSPSPTPSGHGYWVTVTGPDDSPLGFPDEHTAGAYAELLIRLRVASELPVWESDHARSLSRAALYERRRALLEAYGLWVSIEERGAPLVSPVPHSAPRPCPELYAECYRITSAPLLAGQALQPHSPPEHPYALVDRHLFTRQELTIDPPGF